MRPTTLLLLLALLLGALGVPPAAAQEATVLTGAVDASDGRAVNALIGVDFLDDQGRRLRRDGCVQSPECPLAGYAASLRVNATLSAEGSTDRAAWATTWSVQVPTGTAQVFVEAYPQNPSFQTDESRYGHAMRHSVRLPTGPVDLRLPLVLCGEGGTVGSLSGTASKDGAPLPVRRVVAWSLESYDPLTRPWLGWTIGTARSDGTFTVPNLPADQRYQLWVTAEDGTAVTRFGVVPTACTDTRADVSFDPPPVLSPVTPVPPSAPTVDTPVVTVGTSATLTGAADPDEVVELWAYSRPSTDDRLVRTTTALPSGLYAFTVTPPTDTRLRVRIDGLDSTPVVLGVRHAVRLAASRLALRSYRFSGTVVPRRAGVRRRPRPDADRPAAADLRPHHRRRPLVGRPALHRHGHLGRRRPHRRRRHQPVRDEQRRADADPLTAGRLRR